MNSAFIVHISRRLRDLASLWLRGVRENVSTFTQLSLGTPPGYPLPEGFPYADLSLRKRFSWIDIYGSEQIQQTFFVLFQFHGVPSHRLASLVWTLKSGQLLLGSFELDGQLYFGHAVPILFDADFILAALISSLQLDRRLRMSSRIQETISNANVHSYFEIFEMRTIGGDDLVQSFGSRQIDPRPCALCGLWLPIGQSHGHL